MRIDEQTYNRLIENRLSQTFFIQQTLYSSNLYYDLYSYNYKNGSGLCIYTVNFYGGGAIKESENFIPPDWLGMEITGMEEFNDVNLIQYGLPDTNE